LEALLRQRTIDVEMGRPARADVAEAVLTLGPDDPAPAYVQLERRVRLAIADGTLQPGDRLPSVRQLAGRLGLAPNTVGRAYAELAREGVIVARAGGGSEVAPRESLDRTALARSRQERLRTLARQAAVRGLALGFDAEEIIGAVGGELAARGHPVASLSAARSPLGPDEEPLLSTRNRLRGRVASLRVGEMLAEVTLRLDDGTFLVAAITRASLDRLSLAEGSAVTGYVKATEIVLGRSTR
jgi:GntR family transcriptional regulator